MGGVEVLHPRDILNQSHHRHHRNRNNFFSMKSESVGIANSGPAVSRSSNRRKRSPPKTILPSLPNVKTTTTTLPLSVRDSNRTTSTDHKNTVMPTTAADLVIGQIRILKRGEVLPTASSSTNVKVKVNVSTKDLKKQQDKISATANGVSTTDLVVLSSSSDLPVPVPDLVPKENIRISDFFYAGSAFVTSPEPSSLPVPVFFKKKEDVSVEGDDDDHSIGTYDATSGLRRLLRLDLS